MYDKTTRDNLTKSIPLEDILAITKDVSPLFLFFSLAERRQERLLLHAGARREELHVLLSG